MPYADTIKSNDSRSNINYSTYTDYDYEIDSRISQLNRDKRDDAELKSIGEIGSSKISDSYVVQPLSLLSPEMQYVYKHFVNYKKASDGKTVDGWYSDLQNKEIEENHIKPITESQITALGYRYVHLKNIVDSLGISQGIATDQKKRQVSGKLQSIIAQERGFVTNGNLESNQARLSSLIVKMINSNPSEIADIPVFLRKDDGSYKLDENGDKQKITLKELLGKGESELFRHLQVAHESPMSKIALALNAELGKHKQVIKTLRANKEALTPKAWMKLDSLESWAIMTPLIIGGGHVVYHGGKAVLGGLGTRIAAIFQGGKIAQATSFIRANAFTGVGAARLVGRTFMGTLLFPAAKAAFAGGYVMGGLALGAASIGIGIAAGFAVAGVFDAIMNGKEAKSTVGKWIYGGYSKLKNLWRGFFGGPSKVEALKEPMQFLKQSQSQPQMMGQLA